MQLPPAIQFGAAALAPAASIVIATPLLVGLGNYRRDFQVIAFCVDCNKCKVSRGDVLCGVSQIIFDKYFYTNFHRSVENTVYRRSQDYEITHADGHEEIDVIH